MDGFPSTTTSSIVDGVPGIDLKPTNSGFLLGGATTLIFMLLGDDGITTSMWMEESVNVGSIIQGQCHSGEAHGS